MWPVPNLLTVVFLVLRERFLLNFGDVGALWIPISKEFTVITTGAGAMVDTAINAIARDAILIDIVAAIIMIFV